jgi:methylenetetrahydrofolate dehydrogenase (NADP+)/methenyltetrahydrofolate cyclohydrolase
MTIQLKGKPVADKIKADMIDRINGFKKDGLMPKIAIVRVGERPDDLAYEERVIKNCISVGIESEIVHLDNNIVMVDFIQVLEQLNLDMSIHGILIFRPLPNQLDLERISRTIKIEKDIDCMSPGNLEKIFLGDKTALAPCTPQAVIEILKHYGYILEGANITLVNRSLVLGKPLAMLLLSENATVTISHSKTKDLPMVTKGADIVVTGVGKANYFDADYFVEKSAIIDVGINFTENGMCGDVNMESVEGKVSAISPVPGGAGTVTSMILLRNLLKAIDLQG